MAVDDISLEMLSPLGVSDGAVRLGPTLQQSRARAVGHANSGKIDIARDITNEVSSAAQDEAHQQPTGVRFVLLYLCILLGAFFIGYDTSCVATLTPIITDEYHALDDFGWYAIAYLLAQCATMLIYGQLYTYYSMKTLYEVSLGVFCVGSVLSATAPTSPAFIVGRAISGLGSAGILAGMNIIVAHTTSLKYRPIFSAVSGGVECVALALGPFISGAIAGYTSWRVGFYIIIPGSAISIVVIFFSIEHLRKADSTHLARKDIFKKVDWVGFGINVPMTLTLVLALQWGGTIYAWNNWRVVLLLVLASVLLVIFLSWERRVLEGSMVPLKLLKQRSVALASIITFCDFAHLAIAAYYLPLYFQAVRGASTFESGLMYLPSGVTLAFVAFIGGPLTTWFGYYNPVMIIGGTLATVGAGLLTTLQPDTPAAKWISYQIVYAAGIGLAFQPPYMAVQTLLADSLVPTALVMLSFAQQLGGIVMLAIAQNVFLSTLSRKLKEVLGPDSRALSHGGALGILRSAPPHLRGEVVQAYNEALRDVLYIVLGLACVVGACMFGLEWRSVRKKKEEEAR